MKPLEQAIALLQAARDIIESEACKRQVDHTRDDLRDLAEDIGPILYGLESFTGVKAD
jgi:hypothetical protein